MTRLVFLGTKGEIEEHTDKHQYHASMMVISEDVRILIDYGLLRKYTLEELKPDLILITHAHPDPYAWLEEDVKTDVPVYLTHETYSYGKFRPSNSYIIAPYEEVTAGKIKWLAYPVIHSLRCPTVGYRMVIDNRLTFVYNPDVVDIPDKGCILTGVDYYIGDGSSIKANLVRRRNDQLFGHTRITTQINWCKKYGIKNIIFTHLGKETLEKEADFQRENPGIILAWDGMELDIV